MTDVESGSLEDNNDMREFGDVALKGMGGRDEESKSWKLVDALRLDDVGNGGDEFGRPVVIFKASRSRRCVAPTGRSMVIVIVVGEGHLHVKT
jgi:hypothetical protein